MFLDGFLARKLTVSGGEGKEWRQRTFDGGWRKAKTGSTRKGLEIQTPPKAHVGISFLYK